VDNEAKHSADWVRTEVLTKDEGPQTGEDSGQHKHDVYHTVAYHKHDVYHTVAYHKHDVYHTVAYHKHDVKHKETASVLWAEAVSEYAGGCNVSLLEQTVRTEQIA